MSEEKANILLIDDNHDNLRFLSSILARQGYEVRPTDSGDKALAAIRAKKPELVLLDVMMPDMSGFDVCSRLKADQNTRDVPVIFISAIHEVEEKVKAFSFGAVDYITKPFQEQEVLARVETHLKLRKFQTLLEEKNQQLQQEINDRKQAEGYLLRIMKAVESTSDAIYISDPQGNHFFQNSGFVDLFEYSSEELAAKGGISAIYRDRNIGKKVLETIMDGRSWTGETEMMSKSGSVLPVHLRADAIRDETEKIIGLIRVHRDISQQRHSEQERIEKEKLQGIIEISGAVCHELNQPLQGISGYTELLMMDMIRTDPYYYAISRIKEEVDRMGTITRKLMNITRYKTKDYLSSKIIDIDKASK
jgi:PAS domain S-box-containing protein